MSAKTFLYALPALALASCVATSSAPVAKAPPASDWVAACEDWDEWDKPGPPFRIHGDTYYVGTCGISAILVTGDDGHALIDTGTVAGTAHVLDNIRKLGFDPADIALLLVSHEHFDHVAGTAMVQDLSGARLVATGPAADVLATGLPSEDDPQFGAIDAFPAARVDETIGAVEFVKQGKLSFMQMPTPGHTPGASSWQWISCEDGDCVTFVYADSMSPISADGYKFSEHRDLLDDYRRGIEYLADSDCDLLLTPHPSASGMRKRLESGNLLDKNACRTYAEGIGKRLDARLAKEAAE